MKLLLLISLLFTVSKASALMYPVEGRYGSYTNYCGLDVSKHPAKDGLIVTAIHNPAYQNHTCTEYGKSKIYDAVPRGDYFKLNNRGLDYYCILRVKDAYEFVQSCFYKATDQLQSSVRYYRY